MIKLLGYSAEVVINSAILSYMVSTAMPKNDIFGDNIIRCQSNGFTPHCKDDVICCNFC